MAQTIYTTVVSKIGPMVPEVELCSRPTLITGTSLYHYLHNTMIQTYTVLTCLLHKYTMYNIFLFLYVSKYLQCVYFHLRPFLKVKEYYF